jgi:hypothetical protein
MNNRSRIWLLLAAAIAVPILTGCGATAPDSVGPPSTDGEDSPPVATAELPCGAADAVQLESIFGAPFGDGTVGSATVTQNDSTWTADSCSWESSDGFELSLRIAEEVDFADGLECLEPLGIGSEVTPVEGIGEGAWWVFEGGDDAEGELRVCAGTAVIDVLVEAASGDSEVLRDQSVALAELALAKLPG